MNEFIPLLFHRITLFNGTHHGRQLGEIIDIDRDRRQPVEPGPRAPGAHVVGVPVGPADMRTGAGALLFFPGAEIDRFGRVCFPQGGPGASDMPPPTYAE